MFKITSLIFSLLFVFMFTSCGSDDDSNNGDSSVTLTNENLIGSWNVTNYTNTQVVTMTANASGQVTTETSETLGQNFTLAYTFSSNPEVISSSGIYTAVTTLENGNIVQSDMIAIVGIEPGSNWNVSNNKITLVNPDFSQEFIVKNFDGDTLELDFVHSYEFDTTIDVFNYTFTSNIILEKQ